MIFPWTIKKYHCFKIYAAEQDFQANRDRVRQVDQSDRDFLPSIQTLEALQGQLCKLIPDGMSPLFPLVKGMFSL